MSDAFMKSSASSRPQSPHEGTKTPSDDGHSSEDDKISAQNQNEASSSSTGQNRNPQQHQHAPSSSAKPQATASNASDVRHSTGKHNNQGQLSLTTTTRPGTSPSNSSYDVPGGTNNLILVNAGSLKRSMSGGIGNSFYTSAAPTTTSNTSTNNNNTNITTTNINNVSSAAPTNTNVSTRARGSSFHSNPYASAGGGLGRVGSLHSGSSRKNSLNLSPANAYLAAGGSPMSPLRGLSSINQNAQHLVNNNKTNNVGGTRPNSANNSNNNVFIEATEQVIKHQEEVSSRTERFILCWGFIFFALFLALPFIGLHASQLANGAITDSSDSVTKGICIALAFACFLCVSWIGAGIFSLLVSAAPNTPSSSTSSAAATSSSKSSSSTSTLNQRALSVLVATSQICCFFIGFWTDSARLPMVISSFTLLLIGVVYGEKSVTWFKYVHAALALVFEILLAIPTIPGAEAGRVSMSSVSTNDVDAPLIVYYITVMSSILAFVALITRAQIDFTSQQSNSGAHVLRVTAALSRYDIQQARAALGLMITSKNNNNANATDATTTRPGSDSRQNYTPQQNNHLIDSARSSLSHRGSNLAATNNRRGEGNATAGNGDQIQNPDSAVSSSPDELLLQELDKLISLMDRVKPHIPDWALTAMGAKANGGGILGSLQGDTEGDIDDDTESSIVLSESASSNQPSNSFSAGVGGGAHELSFGGSNKFPIGSAEEQQHQSGSKDVVSAKISIVLLNYHLDPSAPTPEYSEHKFVERVNAVARSLHGVAHHFIGSRAVVSWNAVRHTAASESKAARFMHTMQLFSGDSHIAISGVAMTGKARCHLAGDRSKHVVLSATWFPMLTYLATVAQARGSLIIDGPTKTAVFFEYNLRGLGIFEFVKHATNQQQQQAAAAAAAAANINQSKRGKGNVATGQNAAVANDGVGDNMPRIHSFDNSSIEAFTGANNNNNNNNNANDVLNGSDYNNNVPGFYPSSPMMSSANNNMNGIIVNDLMNSSSGSAMLNESTNNAFGGSFFAKGQSVLIFELIGERHQDNVEWLMVYRVATSGDNTVRDIDALSCVALELAGQGKFNEAYKILKRVQQLSAPGEARETDNFTKETFTCCKMMLDRLVPKKDGQQQQDADDVFIDGSALSIKVGYM